MTTFYSIVMHFQPEPLEHSAISRCILLSAESTEWIAFLSLLTLAAGHASLLDKNTPSELRPIYAALGCAAAEACTKSINNPVKPIVDPSIVETSKAATGITELACRKVDTKILEDATSALYDELQELACKAANPTYIAFTLNPAAFQNLDNEPLARALNPPLPSVPSNIPPSISAEIIERACKDIFRPSTISSRDEILSQTIQSLADKNKLSLALKSLTSAVYQRMHKNRGRQK